MEDVDDHDRTPVRLHQRGHPDLPKHRAAVADACVRQDFVPRVTEDIAGASGATLESGLRADRRGVGLRSGAGPPVRVCCRRGETCRSPSWNTTKPVAAGVPRLVFLMDDDHPVRLSDVDKESRPSGSRRSRSVAAGEAPVAWYRSADDLREQVMKALIAFPSIARGRAAGLPQASGAG